MPDPSSPSKSSNPCKAIATLDRQFLDVRAKLIEIAAALDRIDRATGPCDAAVLATDARMIQLRRAVEQLLEPDPGRAERLQMTFSL
jgi:hypothetical protein